MSTNGSRACPVCNAVLELGHKNGLATLECPSAHGVGINILEAYSHLQRDELEAIWNGAKHAPASTLISPISGKPMVQVTFPVDSDMGSSPGVGANEMTIEFDPENQFGWFSFDELRAMPSQDAERGPAAPGLVGLDQMDDEMDDFDQFFDQVEADRQREEHHPTGFAGAFSHLARRLRP